MLLLGDTVRQNVTIYWSYRDSITCQSLKTNPSPLCYSYTIGIKFTVKARAKHSGAELCKDGCVFLLCSGLLSGEMSGWGWGKEWATATTCSETAADKLFSTKPYSKSSFSSEYLQSIAIILGLLGFEKSHIQNEVRFTSTIKICGWEAMTIAQQLKQFSTHTSNHSEENNARTLVAKCDFLFYLVLKWFGSSSNPSKNCLR